MPFTKKRKFTRVPFDTEIEIIAGETVIVALGLRDISLGGAFILTDEFQTESTSCRMVLSLIGPASLLRIEIDAEILRSEDDGIAVEFTEIDLDSLVRVDQRQRLLERSEHAEAEQIGRASCRERVFRVV